MTWAPPVLRRLAAFYLFLLALVVAGHYFAYPLYERGYGPDESPAQLVWLIIDPFQVAGLALLLGATFAWKRALPADTGWREYLEANVLFYLTVVTAISFLPNWFLAQWGDAHRQLWDVWAFIDAAIPILSVSVGLRLWREAAEGV